MSVALYCTCEASDKRFSRVVIPLDNDIDEEEIKYQRYEEISKAHPIIHSNHATILSKKIYLSEFINEGPYLYGIATKYLRQCEDIFLSNPCTPLSEDDFVMMNTWIVNVLETHKLIEGMSDQNSNIHRNLINFSRCLTKFSEFEVDAFKKLLSALTKILPEKESLNARYELQIRQYFHLHLDILWHCSRIRCDNGIDVPELLRELHFVAYHLWLNSKSAKLACDCIDRIWLRIFCSMKETFWQEVNGSLQCYDEEWILYQILHLTSVLPRHVAMLYDNMSHINSTWLRLIRLTPPPSEEKLLYVLHTIGTMLTDLWMDKATLDFYYVTWEFFYKKIDSITHAEVEFRDLLDFVTADNFIGDIRRPNCNSFILFLKLLRRHLFAHPGHWGKFKGRIFTKFPPAKFAQLSARGVFNVALLFAACAQQDCFDDVLNKLALLISEGLKSRLEHRVISWDIFMALMQLSLKENRSISKLYEYFESNIMTASNNRNTFPLIQKYSAQITALFAATDNLMLDQWLIIGSWLPNYLRCCKHNEFEDILKALTTVARRIIARGMWFAYQKAMETNVLSVLPTLNSPSRLIGTLGGLIVAQSDAVEGAVEQFCSAPPIVLINFHLTLITESLHATNSVREMAALKAWFLCSIVGASDPTFTKEVLRKHSSNEMSFKQFLLQIDRDTLQMLVRDAMPFFIKHINAQVHLNIATVLDHCGHLLYTPQSTANSFIETFIDKFLLSVEIVRGKDSKFVVDVIPAWHLYVRSLWNLNKLVGSDPYLERVVKDLIIHYIPRFGPPSARTEQNYLRAFLATFAHPDDELLHFFCNKLAHCYFSNGQAHVPDETMIRVMNVAQAMHIQIVDRHGADGRKLLLEQFLPGLLEVFMFKPMHRSITLDLVKKLHHPTTAVPFSNLFLKTARQHIEYNMKVFFHMALIFAKLFPHTVSIALPEIKDEIQRCEAKHGQGFNKHLRDSFSQLVKLCSL